ncbi:MAG: hypothetical protein P4M11_11705, partial [Candidatus Pacebacteria bacterium]|nr:hypothetical protein [Candidatus Paceibacterota bacterium]
MMQINVIGRLCWAQSIFLDAIFYNVLRILSSHIFWLLCQKFYGRERIIVGSSNILIDTAAV